MALIDDIKVSRDQKLTQSDFTQMPDYPMDPSERSNWVIYRQALRDLPENQDLTSMTDISQVVWPTQPS